jgi:hypothetical protein
MIGLLVSILLLGWAVICLDTKVKALEEKLKELNK